MAGPGAREKPAITSALPDLITLTSPPKQTKALPYKEKRLARRDGDGAQPGTVSKGA
jgi:hypothetical protein